MVYEKLKKKFRSITEKEPWVTTPAEIIKLAGGSRRSWKLIDEVELLLDENNLITQPAFSNTYAHGQISVIKKKEIKEEIPPPAPENKDATQTTETPSLSFVCSLKGDNCDPIPRLSRLHSANLRNPFDKNKTALVSIHRDAPLEEAITLMLKYNYSQLPIMHGNRRVEGMISWRSIGKAHCMGKCLTRVYDCKEEAEVVSISTPLLEVVERILKKEVVLVKDTDEVICGIITGTDITNQFLLQAEPFFLVEQIEKIIRMILLRSDITLEEMKNLLDPEKLDKEIKGVADFSFGQYILILQNENIFKRLNLSVSRSKVVEYLNQIKDIRNEIMHFAVDQTSAEDLKHLRETLHLLTEIVE